VIFFLEEVDGISRNQVQHEQLLQLESRIGGGALHVFCGAYGNVVVGGAGMLRVVDLTRTGIAEPVLRLKGRWARTTFVLYQYSTYLP